MSVELSRTPAPGTTSAVNAQPNVAHITQVETAAAQRQIADRQVAPRTNAWERFAGAYGDRAILGDARMRIMSLTTLATNDAAICYELVGATYINETMAAPLWAGCKALFAR